MKKIGFVGCGEWARKKYLPFLRANRSICNVEAACDIILAEEKKLISAQIPDIVFFDDIKQMLDKTKLDGLIITLPHSMHYQAIFTSLQSSLPCLIDKPLCPTFDEAEKLVKMADERGVTITVSSQRRYQRGNLLIKSLLEQSKLGNLHWLEGRFFINSYLGWHKSWRNNPSLSGSVKHSQGLILDSGYHLIDTILYLTNYALPKSVYALASKREYNVDVDSTVLLDYGTYRATLTFSRGLAVGENIETIHVMGSHGHASSEIIEKEGNKVGTFNFSTQSERAEEIIQLDFPLQPLKDFIAFLGGEKMPDMWLAKNTLPTLKVINAIYESIESGEIVKLEEINVK